MPEEFTAAAVPPSGPVFTRRIYLGAPAEAVWEWLVDPEKSRQYSLCDLVTRPGAVGDPMLYVHKLAGQPVVDGTVEEILEGRRLVHSFQFQDDPPESPSRVTYELIRYGDQMCCLELRHDRFEENSETLGSISTSWDVALSSLKTLVETGRPLPWPRRR